MEYSSNHSQPLMIYMGKGKLWLFSFACLAFIATGAWILSLHLRGEEMLLYGVIGGICIIIFAACLLFFIRKLLDHSPGLVIDHEGILDNSSYIAGGLIRWEDIRHIEMYQLTGQVLIGIQLNDPEAYLRNQQGLKLGLIKINLRLVNAPVNIAQSALRMPLSKIYEEMLIRWHLYQRSRTS
ncbi:STM3941 family protein [Paenibacillus sp. FSL R7-0273]|uniref:STM3941 family protein n=1 Tax=Paenibacillus sp. FSL R7-0273 TaxID=1536772 RepID=UPI0006932FBE|nr:STM3941 family protein [Paenibacillus sp. FSL R7-0273]OMF96084.1 hypothetical protein BK144_05790 [Paenibacillus sp. FSL R7-0273]